MTQYRGILLDELADDVIRSRYVRTLMPYRIRILTGAKRCRKYFWCAAYMQPRGKTFELILSLKMETRHLVREPFSREFSAFIIIAELWRPEVARPRKILRNFFGKTTSYCKIFKNYVPKVFTASAIDVVVLKCLKIFPTGNRWNRVLFTGQKNKISAPFQTVATARISPKICQGRPPTFGSQYSKCHPNRFIFGGVTAERAKTVLLAHRINPWFALNTFEANNNRRSSRSYLYASVLRRSQ